MNTALLRQSDQDIRFYINTPERLIDFNRIIAPSSFLPTDTFEFSFEVLSHVQCQQHVHQFAQQYGNLIKNAYMLTLSSPDETPAETERIKSNIATILKSAAHNLEALKVTSEMEMGHVDLPPNFPLLKWLFVAHYENNFDRGDDDPESTFLALLSSRVPSLSTFHYSGRNRDFVKTLPRILNNLSLMNDKVKVTLDFLLGYSDSSHIQEIINSRSPTIVEFCFKLSKGIGTVAESIEIREGLYKWLLLHSNTIRKLQLADDEPLNILEHVLFRLPSLPNLVMLDILEISHGEENGNLHFHPHQLPNLTLLKMGSLGGYFFEGVFASVSILELRYGCCWQSPELERHLQSTFPNLSKFKLFTNGSSMRIAFKYFQLKVLEMNFSCRCREIPAGEYWDLITGNKPRILEAEVCTFAVDTSPPPVAENEEMAVGLDEDRMYTFQDLRCNNAFTYVNQAPLTSPHFVQQIWSTWKLWTAP